MRIKLAFLPSITLLWMLASFTSNAQTTKQVVHHYLEAIGGSEKWKEIETITQEDVFIKIAHENIFVLNKNDTLNVITKFKRPDKVFYKSSGINDSLSSILCFNGDVFWTQSKSGDLAIQSKEDGASFSKMTHIGLADVLLDKNAEIEYLGIEKLKDKEFYTLRLKREGWMFSSKFFFDMDTGLPFCSTGFNTPTIRYTLYKEYRAIDGIMFHHLEEGYDEHWNLESRSLFNKRKINVEIADSEFNLPSSRKK